MQPVISSQEKSYEKPQHECCWVVVIERDPVGRHTRQAQTTANGPYYATPSWDQTLPSPTRFIILSNFASAAVLDRNTGLVWEKAPATTPQNWSNARFNCIGKDVGGQKGWRLPSIPELTSLLHPANTSPALPTGHPFTDVQSGEYWSATTDAEFPTAAWVAGFDFSGVTALSKQATLRVWCVRGGMNADQY